ncbi:hypothetical protein [Niallia endozanthoxylica]|uniref:Uncharacterized protein n=1 Tax=Niallia endozanthoxylica TaxID=2036016 RepID=A0A5J5GZZ9_9BACI|nr:hypothetical protein [Niallia endozanthoxylica]KAA9013567.1 hypothetical protein F4V44_24615 [Niallia endozanthoxylica]
MMSFNQMKKLFGKQKSVPTGHKNNATTNSQVKKVQQSKNTLTDQRKVYLSDTPRKTQPRKCCGR